MSILVRVSECHLRNLLVSSTHGRRPKRFKNYKESYKVFLKQKLRKTFEIFLVPELEKRYNN